MHVPNYIALQIFFFKKHFSLVTSITWLLFSSLPCFPSLHSCCCGNCWPLKARKDICLFLPGEMLWCLYVCILIFSFPPDLQNLLPFRANKKEKSQCKHHSVVFFLDIRSNTTSLTLKDHNRHIKHYTCICNGGGNGRVQLAWLKRYSHQMSDKLHGWTYYKCFMGQS